MEKTALITGASSGIGLELARLLAKDKFDLVLIARRRDNLRDIKTELESQHKIKVTAIVQDLTATDAPSKIFDGLQKQDIHVDVLINNAGFGLYGKFTSTSWQAESLMIDLNIKVLTKLTKLFLPAMLEKKSGRILNVASIASFFPGPNMSVYFATKAYVLSFTEALVEELKGSGVTATCLCPGPTKTGFQKVANQDESSSALESMDSARAVAEYGYDAMLKGKAVAVYGASNKSNLFFQRLLPRSMVRKIVGKRMKDGNN